MNSFMFENRILHLAIDEKFLDLDFINNLLKISSAKDHFFIIVSDSEIKFPITHDNINFRYVKKCEIMEALKVHLPFKKLIIHGFIDQMRTPILNLPKNITITAIVYGFEFYSKIKDVNLYKRKTKKILKSITKKKRTINTSYKDFIYTLIYKIKQKNILNKSFKRIDVIAHYIPQEYLMFKRKLNLNAEFLAFNMGSYESLFPELAINNQKNILIGNSADSTNNHLDTMNMIDQSQIKNNCKIYCPLSYAYDKPIYIEKVIEYGEKKFGSVFNPVRKYLDKDDFVRLLNTCEIIILNQHRSQGIFSAFAAFYFKKTLWLSENNPFYEFICDLGIKAFIIENGIDLTKQLTEEELIKNQNVYMKNFNSDTVLMKYKKLIS